MRRSDEDVRRVADACGRLVEAASALEDAAHACRIARGALLGGMESSAVRLVREAMEHVTRGASAAREAAAPLGGVIDA